MHNLTRTGFTLLELLVAMAITAILAGVLFMNLNVAFNAQKTATASLDVSRTAALAMQLLSDDLQNTLQPAAAAGTTSSLALVGNFEGTSTNDAHGNPEADLIFYTTSYASQQVDANGEVKYVELAVEQRPNGENVLVRRVSANLLDPNSISASQGSLTQQGLTTETETICRNCQGFSLRYWTGSDWLDTWDSTAEDNTVPAAVEVTLRLQRPGDDSNSGKPLTFVRVFPISCSTAVQDTNVNSGGTSLP